MDQLPGNLAALLRSRRHRHGTSCIELIIVIAIMLIVMSMVGIALVKIWHAVEKLKP